MVTFVEKPRNFEAFYFHGGLKSFETFARWAHKRGLMAAYQPPQTWVDEDAVCGSTVPISQLVELVYIRNRGYIKGAPDFTMALEPDHWFVMQPDGQFVMMTHKEVAERFRTGDHASMKEFQRVTLLQGDT
jgi:hypothetical protein